MNAMTLEKAITTLASQIFARDAEGAVDAWEVVKEHLTAHAQMVEKVREVIASIDLRAETYLDPQCKTWANKLAVAIGDAHDHA